MFVVANLISALASILSIVFTCAQWLVIIWAVLSWVSPDPNNPLVQTIRKFAELLLSPIRKIFPFLLKFGLDLSPFIALLVIFFLQRFLISSMYELASRIRMG